jgi:hypothetical protein
VQRCHAGKIMPPLVKIGMLHWYGFNLIIGHPGVWLLFLPVAIKFFFK